MISSSTFKEIASITQGYPFRETLQNIFTGNIGVLQVKNINDDLGVNLTNLVSVADEGYKEKHYLQAGDIILAARGRTKIGVVSDLGDRRVIASVSLYIIRPHTDVLLPKYLAVYLQSVGYRQLQERMMGATIVSLHRHDLENMQISVPSLDFQQRIVDIYECNQRLQSLYAQKQTLQDKIAQGMINTLITHELI